LTNKQTDNDKQTPLKTSTSLHYDMPVGKNIKTVKCKHTLSTAAPTGPNFSFVGFHAMFVHCVDSYY